MSLSISIHHLPPITQVGEYSLDLRYGEHNWSVEDGKIRIENLGDINRYENIIAVAKRVLLNHETGVATLSMGEERTQLLREIRWLNEEIKSMEVIANKDKKVTQCFCLLGFLAGVVVIFGIRHFSRG